MKTQNFEFDTGRQYAAGTPQIIRVEAIKIIADDDFMVTFSAMFFDDSRGISGRVQGIAFGHSQDACKEAVMAEYDAGRYHNV